MSHTRSVLRAYGDEYGDEDQKYALGVNGNTIKLILPREVLLREQLNSIIEANSLTLGKRQSLWLAKVLPFKANAAFQFMPLAEPAQVLAPALPPHVMPSEHCFHIKPVFLWVTVPSPLSVKSVVGVLGGMIVPLRTSAHVDVSAIASELNKQVSKLPMQSVAVNTLFIGFSKK